MAAYIPVPRDLSRVKSKILFNLTKRQLICFGAAALVGVPSFFLLRQIGNISVAAILMIIIMLPMFFLGMYEKDGMPPETVVKLFIQAKFIRPKIRPFQTDNYYAVLMRQDKARKEIEKIVCRTEKDINRKPKAAKNGNSKKSEQSGQKTCAGYTRKGG